MTVRPCLGEMDLTRNVEVKGQGEGEGEVEVEGEGEGEGALPTWVTAEEAAGMSADTLLYLSIISTTPWTLCNKHLVMTLEAPRETVGVQYMYENLSPDWKSA